MNVTNYKEIIRKTDRLVLRPIKEEDFGIIKESLKRQGQAKNKYDNDEIEFTNNYTELLCRQQIKSSQSYAVKDKAFIFRVFRKSDGVYIGGIIIKTILRKNFQWAEIGYWLLNQYWRNGYGTEMVKSGINIAFHELGFHRLEAQINLDNTASQRTAENAGMELECIRKGFIYEFDEWTDNMIYVIYKKEI